jgi:Predicted xylanase/chitin deacetylase
MADLLEFVDYSVELDIIRDYKPKTKIVFMQNDKDSAKLLFSFTKLGKPIDMSGVTGVLMAFKKPDGTLVWQGEATTVDKTQGKYTVTLRSQVLAAVGRVFCHANFTLAGKTIETRQMFFDIEKSFVSDETIESSNDFPVIEKAIEVGQRFEGVDIDGVISAGQTATEAKTTADNLVSRVDNIVGNAGSSNTEIVDMRNDARGVTYTTAKQRVDAIQVIAEKNKVYSSFPPLPNLYDTASNLILTANDATKWGTKLQVSTDSTIKYEGQNTVKFDHQAGQGSPYGNIDLTTPADFTNIDYVELIIYISGGNSVGANSNLRLYSGTAGSFKVDLYRYISPASGQKEGWKRIRINKGEFTVNDGTPVWNNITKVFLAFTISSSAVASINLAKISTKNVQTGILNMDFDDSLISVYDKAFPVMEKYGLKGNIYVITSRVGTAGYMSWKQLQEFRQAGWTIGSHTDLHQNISTLTRDQIIKEFDDSQRKLRNHGFYSGSYFFAAPLGGWSDIAREEALKRFWYARVYRQTPVYDSIPADDTLLAGYRSVLNTDTLELVKGEVDAIVSRKMGYNMTFHDIESTIPGQYNWTLANFEALCQYIADKRDAGQLKVLTAEEKVLQFAGVESNFNGKHSVLTSDQEGTVVLKLNRN